jgi:hypothetical protein
MQPARRPPVEGRTVVRGHHECDKLTVFRPLCRRHLRLPERRAGARLSHPEIATVVAPSGPAARIRGV